MSLMTSFLLDETNLSIPCIGEYLVFRLDVRTGTYIQYDITIQMISDLSFFLLAATITNSISNIP